MFVIRNNVLEYLTKGDFGASYIFETVFEDEALLFPTKAQAEEALCYVSDDTAHIVEVNQTGE